MFQAKFNLPYFDGFGNELHKEHAEVRDRLLRAYGFVERIRLEILYKDAATNKVHLETAYQYKFQLSRPDIPRCMEMLREFGHLCRQKHLGLIYAPVMVQNLDLEDIKDDRNWQIIADQRLKDRQEANSPWKVAAK